jgi:hypothetical protein
MILERFSALINHSLDIDDYELPLATVDRDRLLTLVPVGESIPLTISDGLYKEDLTINNEAGSLIVVRGQAPRKFPRGSILCFEITIAVIKYLICNYDCCSDVPCPKEPISVSGTMIEDAKVGVPWHGAVVFRGDPKVFATTPLPTWMTWAAGANYITLEGEPTEAGNVTLAVSVTDNAGNLVVRQIAFEVQDAE